MTTTPSTFHENLKLLTSLIARKPQHYTAALAKTVDEAFEHYTNTHTVNFLQAINLCLIDIDWPFPSYVDVSSEITLFHKELLVRKIIKNNLWHRLHIAWKVMKGVSLFSEPILLPIDPQARLRTHRIWMTRRFRRNLHDVFTFLNKHQLLQNKKPILNDAFNAYKKQMWAACISSAIPLIDLVMRSYFGTDNLRISVSNFVKQMRAANIAPSDFMPGFTMYDMQGMIFKNKFAKSHEDDLRLVGVYLSSFAYFAEKYYAWHDSASITPTSPLNRHAVMHCASEYWTEENAARILVFLDLTLKLEKPIKILIHGQAAIIPPTHS